MNQLIVTFFMMLMPFAQADAPIGVFDTGSGKPETPETLKTYPFTGETIAGNLPSAIRFDLNGDGVEDFFRIYGRSFCGTGGCPIEIFDGRSKQKVADLFGNPVWVFPTKINGWPNLTVYSHGSAASGSYTSLAFDGKKYVTVSSVYLYDKSVEELFQKYQSTRKIE